MKPHDTRTGRGRPRAFDRAAALAKAMDVFWAKGYEGASLAELTEAMGINPPSLYAAFGSKEALFLEAVQLYSVREDGPDWDAVLEAPSARAGIARLLDESAVAFTRRGKPRGCLIALGALHDTGANASVCAKLRAYRTGNLAKLRRRLERAATEGEIPRTVDCDAVASFYLSIQHGMSILARDGASRATLLAVARAAMDAWACLTSPRGPEGDARSEASTKRGPV
ncbi:MAG TPA: TetR/AcrR family transcriptional regulator [Burkholderiales bacterium]